MGPSRLVIDLNCFAKRAFLVCPAIQLHNELDFIRRIGTDRSIPVHYANRIVMKFDSPLDQRRNDDLSTKVFFLNFNVCISCSKG